MSIFASIAKHCGKILNKLLDLNTDYASKVVIKLKINASAMDNHHPPAPSPFSCAVTEFFKTSLRDVVCVREDLNTLNNTQIFKPLNITTIWSRTFKTHANIREVKCRIWRKHCFSESSLHSNLFCPAVSPPSSPLFSTMLQMPCISFDQSPLCAHYSHGLAFSHVWKLANYRMASCH